MIYNVKVGEKEYRVELSHSISGWQCKVDGREFPLDVVPLSAGALSMLVDGKSYEVHRESGTDETSIVVGRERFNVQVRDPRSLRSRGERDGGAHGPRKITAPMPGKVVRIIAPVGTEVEPGQAVLVIEAMKMQNELKAPKKGRVRSMNVAEGAAVEAGQTLAEVE